MATTVAPLSPALIGRWISALGSRVSQALFLNRCTQAATPQGVDLISDPLPLDTVDFRDLGAEGATRGVERFTFGSSRYFAFPSGMASLGELMRTGFAVNWVPTRIPQ